MERLLAYVMQSFVDPWRDADNPSRLETTASLAKMSVDRQLHLALEVHRYAKPAISKDEKQ
jgi:hypothetical protein